MDNKLKKAGERNISTMHEYDLLDFHALALRMRKFFDEHEEFITDTVCGHLAIMVQNLLQEAITKAKKEQREEICAIIKQATLDAPEQVHLNCVSRILNKINLQDTNL